MNNLDKQYLELLTDVLKNGKKKKDRTGVGTYSVFGRQMRFKMSEGFPLLTTKKIFTKAMFHELLWFLKGGDNIKYLVDNDVRIWNEWPHKKYNQMHPDHPLTMEEYVDNIKNDKKFAHLWGQLGPVYGKQWVDWGGGPTDLNGTYIYDEKQAGLNQIDQVINDLKNNPDSRRIMVSAWNPAELSSQLLPPCHYAFQLWTSELTAKERQDIYHNSGRPVKMVAHIHNESEDVQHDKEVNRHIHEFLDSEGIPRRGVSLMFHMRSVDCFLGMPFDIASYGALLHMIAHCTDMQPDELIITSGDTHIYLNHLDQVKEQCSREPYELPTLTINTPTKNIYEIKYEDFVINNYKCHPSIKADVAV